MSKIGVEVNPGGPKEKEALELVKRFSDAVPDRTDCGVVIAAAGEIIRKAFRVSVPKEDRLEAFDVYFKAHRVHLVEEIAQDGAGDDTELERLRAENVGLNMLTNLCETALKLVDSAFGVDACVNDPALSEKRTKALDAVTKTLFSLDFAATTGSRQSKAKTKAAFNVKLDQMLDQLADIDPKLGAMAKDMIGAKRKAAPAH